MSDDDTPISSTVLKALLAETSDHQREWRDEVRAQFRALGTSIDIVRADVGNVRERMTVIESTAEGGDLLRTNMQTQHEALALRVVECERKHGEHASRDTVDKLGARFGAARLRLPAALKHALTAALTAAALTAAAHLTGDKAKDQAAPAQPATTQTQEHRHGP